MEKPKRHRYHNQRQQRGASTRIESAQEVNEDSAIIKYFRCYQSALDSRHDRHERIVKHSRDVTIESKRVIFLLHRMSGSSTSTETLNEAEQKLAEIEMSHWCSVAKELQNQDPYQFLRAYTHGLQEYIEALSFWYYLKEDCLISLPQVQERLRFTQDLKTGDVENLESCDSQVKQPDESVVKESVDVCSADEQTKHENATNQLKDACVHIPPQEYMLGIADLTGELMRLAINSVGNGDLDRPSQLCKFMRVIYDAFASFGNMGRDMNQKLRVLKQSLVKVENACYNLQVRGSEIPTHMLKDIFNKSSEPTAGFEEFVGT